MPTITWNEQIAMVTEHCCSCGTLFAFTEQFKAERKKTGASWYCPNGHSQHYTESTVERLRKTQAALEEQQRATTRAKSEALALQHQIEAQAKEAKRLAKRTHAGVCTCCNRSFTNLRRHMATKHPTA